MGWLEAHAAAIRDSVSSALDAFRELGSGPDPSATARFYSESPAFRFYENGALRYESAADVRVALGGLGPGMANHDGVLRHRHRSAGAGDRDRPVPVREYGPG